MAILTIVGNWLLTLLSRLLPTIQVPVPQTPPPVSPPPAPPALTPLAEVILAYNNGHSYFNASTVWTLDVNGVPNVVIHKTTSAQAQLIATALQSACDLTGYPITFALACLAVESVLDPLCQNANIAPGESNAGNPSNLSGYDMGVGQFKIVDLIGNEGLTTEPEAWAFALDPTKALPYHIKVMQSKIEWARGIIAKGFSGADYRFGNPYLLATCAYNFGETGVLNNWYYKGIFPDGQDGRQAHGISVINDEAYFAEKLRLPSIFISLKQS